MHRICSSMASLSHEPLHTLRSRCSTNADTTPTPTLQYFPMLVCLAATIFNVVDMIHGSRYGLEQDDVTHAYDEDGSGGNRCIISTSFRQHFRNGGLKLVAHSHGSERMLKQAPTSPCTRAIHTPYLRISSTTTCDIERQ